MVRLNKIVFSNNSTKMTYHYSFDTSLDKYFNKNEFFYVKYEESIEAIPESINVIPFLANIMPIAWFLGFDVKVDEVDETFFNSLIELKREFAIHFPQIKSEGKLIADKLVKNEFTENNYAQLFSGGLDAFESFTRNFDENPFLVSILGADIEIKDTFRWNEFKKFNELETIIQKDRICYVESNLRTFYTYEVDLLVGVGWWGKVQHGMALLTLIAPLSFIHGITTTIIASSNTGEVSFGWGSTFETDEKVRWANQKVIHDGFHLRRTEKIENIVSFAKSTGNKVKLRVCYSELRKGYNCSRCTKCQRTMLGFVLDGANPNEYGFEIPKDFYPLILKNFNQKSIMTTGVKYEWQCLQDKAKSIEKPYIFKNAVEEIDYFNTFVALDLNEIVNRNQDKIQKQREKKFIIINKLPKLFKLYLKLRRKF